MIAAHSDRLFVVRQISFIAYDVRLGLASMIIRYSELYFFGRLVSSV